MATGIRAANPIWFFVDLVGLPLNDQYYISFLTNTFPYLPQPVFHDVNLTTPWPDPLQFYPNGTLPDNMYWDPDLVWRLEIRQGPTQSDPLIYEINNFQPGLGGSVTPTNLQILTAENQITDPQFAEIFFTSPYTITTAGTYNIAPGWDLVLTGTGSTTLAQLILSGASVTVDPNGNSIPYALKIDNAGWATAILQQRLKNNGALWAGGAVGGLLVGRSEGANQIVTMHYVPSSGATDNTILTANLTTGNFTVFSDGVNIPTPSTNTDLSDVAFVDINIVLPTTGIVDLTDIQLTGQNGPLPQSPLLPEQKPVLVEETIERGIDHTFHVFENSLITQPKTNILTGWLFGLNPWQFRTTTVSNVANNTYTADQTIVVQQAYVASATANNVAVGQGANAEDFAFIVKAVTATNKFALVQYIDPATIRPYWGKLLSSLVNVTSSTPTHSTAVRFKMRLIYRTSLPSTIGQNEPIASWSNVDGSTPVFSAGWTAIAPLNDPEYTIDANSSENFSFNQFQLPASSNDNMTLGIVIYTTNNMAQTAIADRLLFNTVSLVHNDFAIEASSETFDGSLRKCQFYYEKSYDNFVLPGTATHLGEIFAEQTTNVTGGQLETRPRSFQILFKQVKRDAPSSLHLYSPETGVADNVRAYLTNNAAIIGNNDVTVSPIWALFKPLSETQGFLIPDTISAIVSVAGVSNVPEGFIVFQYAADARLGI